MPTTTVRITSLAVVACGLAWLVAAAVPAAAGTYTVSACTAAKRFGHQTPPTGAFLDLSALPNVATGGMDVRRACADWDGKRIGSHGNLISLILQALEPDVDYAFHMAVATPAVYRLTHDGLRWRVMGGHGFSPLEDAS